MTSTWFPVVDSSRCKADCFACINFCPQKVYTKKNGNTEVAFPEKCIDKCSSCQKICPEKAISFLTTGFIDIDGIKVGISGMDKAFSKGSFDDAFIVIENENYIPSGAKDKFREAIRKEYEKVNQMSKIKSHVIKRYTEAVQTGRGCCSSCSCSATDQAKDMGYSEDELRGIPESANLGLGCGNPTAFAELKEGETVLDLGSGAGIDAFLAARRVGKSGKVIGVDMTEAMITKARKNAEAHGYANVEFRLGEIEDMPVDDSSVDVIISNCVINLAEDKLKTFREAFRVLKQGGRMLVSDIVTDGKLPDEVLKSLDAWAECIAGALPREEYVSLIKKAGFRDVIIVSENAYSEPGLDRRIDGKIISVKVRACK